LDPAPLRHLRLSVATSRGRRYPELPHPYRNDFQRDRDRIVHARAFRRLEDKTQVFTAGYSDHFRNRLTHTIEVAQISRTLAGVLGLDEDLTEALALAHDIGHPPFAHAGEEELDKQMQAFGERFDHNLHSLRIVDRFEQRYARFPGLNLTFEVREGMVKHSRDFEPGQIPALEEYAPGLRPPLEAQLIDPADEVAYSAADLDDGYAAGFFGLDEIAQGVPHFQDIAEAVEMQFAGAPERVRFSEALRALLDHLVTGLLEGTLRAASDAGVRTTDDVRAAPRLASFTPDAYGSIQSLKRFLREKLYYSGVLVQEREAVRERIGRLFRYLTGNPGRLPEQYQESSESVQRVVCDYIAGMTDGYFNRTYSQLIGEDGSSRV
jgi:dGTPase